MEEGGGGGGGPPDYCPECKVYGHTRKQHCSEDNCTDINCTSGFHLCFCSHGHRTREYIANSRFPLSKNKRRKTCEGMKAASAAYRAANAVALRAASAARAAAAAAEREETARELAAANPTLGIQPRSLAQVDALVTEVLASPLMRELLDNPRASFYIFTFHVLKSGVNHEADPTAWREAMEKESESALTCDGVSNKPVLRLPKPRTNNRHRQTTSICKGKLRSAYGWAVQEFTDARSPLVIDVKATEKRLHQRGKHRMGVGGHLWQKDGGSNQTQNDSKIYSVAVIYKKEGWLSAGGAILLRDDYRAAYFAQLTTSGVKLPLWTAAYAGGVSSGGGGSSSSASGAAAAAPDAAAAVAGASSSSAAATPPIEGPLSLSSFVPPPPAPSPLDSAAAAGLPFTPSVATESGGGGSDLDSRGGFSGMALSFGVTSRGASTSASAAAAAGRRRLDGRSAQSKLAKAAAAPGQLSIERFFRRGT